MVLIKPFFQGGSLARERKRYREHLSVCIPAPKPVPCIFKKPGVQQELGHEDPRTPTLEARRQAEILGQGQASFSETLPLAELPLSTKHCLKTTDSSSSSLEHTRVPSLHSGPEGHHIELAIKDEAELGGGGTGQRPSCPQGEVAGSQGKAFTLAASSAWMPGSLGGEILFSEPPPLMPRALIPNPCFHMRPPAKSLTQQLSACLELSFLCECQALTLAHSDSNTNQKQQKPSPVNHNCPPLTYPRTTLLETTSITAATRDDRASHFSVTVSIKRIS